MTLGNLGRRDRIAAAALLFVLGGLLIPSASALAAPTTFAASGGSAISADEFGTSRYTTLLGPALAEGNTGDLALNSTTILNIPAGFRFNPGVGAASVNTIECDLQAKVTVTATQATLTVTHVSTVPGCFLWFVGLEVQPTSGSGLDSGYITKTGTSSAPGGGTTYGKLTKVAGKVSQLIYGVQPSSNNSGGTNFATQPEIDPVDQFGNSVRNAPVTLSITPGTGPAGARLSCARNPVSSGDSGVADFDQGKCRINRPGSYRLRATSGHVTRDSGTITVAVGPAVGLAFKAYPGSTTKRTFSPQPRVAVVDAGGNIVTSYPTVHITLGINKNAATFTCNNGLTVVTAINGVAQFQNCKQTTLGSNYHLTAWLGAVGALGAAFKVTN